MRHTFLCYTYFMRPNHLNSRHRSYRNTARQHSLSISAQRFLAAFEGLEGGFAIGTSIVVALSFTELEREVLLATAIISIIVSGFNSSAVKYSTEHYLDQLDGREKRNRFKYYFLPALIEFLAYTIISFITILPLTIISSEHIAIGMSVVLTLLILFVAGYWRALVLHMHTYRDALETMLLGGSIISVGVVSGYVLHLLQVG